MQGGTRVTLTGINLGQSYEEIKGGVYVVLTGNNRVNCKVNGTGTHNSSVVVCTTPESAEVSGPFRIDITNIAAEGLHAVSKSIFSFHVSIWESYP